MGKLSRGFELNLGNKAMTSPAKLASNKRNAQKSTGPRTDAGKSKAKMNATTHGLRALSPVVPGENEKDWQQFHKDFLEEFMPQGVIETQFADRVASLMWRLRRVPYFEAGMISQKAEKAKIRLARETDAADEAQSKDWLRYDENTATITTTGMRLDTFEKNLQKFIELNRLFSEYLEGPLHKQYSGKDAMAILDASWRYSLPEDYSFENMYDDGEAESQVPPTNPPSNTDAANLSPAEVGKEILKEFNDMSIRIRESKNPIDDRGENIGQGQSPNSAPLNPDPSLTAGAAGRVAPSSSGNPPPDKSPKVEAPTNGAAEQIAPSSSGNPSPDKSPKVEAPTINATANGAAAEQPPATPENTNQGKASETEPPQFAPIRSVHSREFLQEIGVAEEHLNFPEDWSGWTARMIGEGVKRIAEAIGWDVEKVVACVEENIDVEREKTEEYLIVLRKKFAELEQIRDQRDTDAIRKVLVPSIQTTGVVIKYEAHLQRQLTQTLNQLIILQIARAKNQPSPPLELCGPGGE